ncbi:hypothetical protein BHE74_00028796 [Ensete ventricosum]|uniref:Uncharacterized protein n=1 Tax=Ensete ventricosum TaxID=4639 RepID=A0A444GCL2_ENSVE|nr:hypothetical protein B296_00003803 [Ensete ventricosum]RWW32603.1 hypothetical protein GW17_00002718 [Ensete ventricosum]RWW63993.1 hypothetical protein BHE74_00028796 [Ensete ventricosum]RZR83375.1 hypothetical protein BHM03_00009973 [Ensete ventricosum]
MDEAMTAAASAPPPPPLAAVNRPLFSAVLAFAVAQFLKLFTTWCVLSSLFLRTCRYKEKRWDSRRLLGSGGMPSSHSATVAALAVAIALEEGTGGSSFALAVILASIVSVMYDASGIRLHASRQAEVCAGAVLGCLVSYLMRGSK